MIETLTLTDFLLARIAEDEATASQATRMASGRWVARGGDVFAQETSTLRRVLEVDEYTDPTRITGEHAARMNPDRVLAECEAKRRIVAAHPPTEHVCPGEPVEWLGIHNTSDGPYHYEMWVCATLAAFALPYADHPDYRDEWRP